MKLTRNLAVASALIFLFAVVWCGYHGISSNFLIQHRPTVFLQQKSPDRSWEVRVCSSCNYTSDGPLIWVEVVDRRGVIVERIELANQFSLEDCTEYQKKYDHFVVYDDYAELGNVLGDTVICRCLITKADVIHEDTE